MSTKTIIGSRKRKFVDNEEKEDTETERCYICDAQSIIFECQEGCGPVCKRHASSCPYNHNMCIKCKPTRCEECQKRICWCCLDQTSRCDICEKEWHDDCSLDWTFTKCTKCKRQHCESCKSTIQETRCVSCYQNLLKKRFVLSASARSISSLLPPLLEIVCMYID